jgi:hypothetical protein
MAIPREAMQRAVDAGHPDHALVALPVSLVREILRALPDAAIAALAPKEGTPA